MQNFIAAQSPVTHQAVGFTVADASLAGHNSGDVIKFPSILYNEGDHFDRDTGIFTCPVTGMYNFHVALRSHPTRVVAASIPYEHSPWLHITMASIYADGAAGMTSSNQAVFKCDQGVKVWVEAIMYSDQLTHGHVMAQFNTFSGFLITPM